MPILIYFLQNTWNEFSLSSSITILLDQSQLPRPGVLHSLEVNVPEKSPISIFYFSRSQIKQNLHRKVYWWFYSKLGHALFPIVFKHCTFFVLFIAHTAAFKYVSVHPSICLLFIFTPLSSTVSSTVTETILIF